MTFVLSKNLKAFINTSFLLLCFFFTSHIRSPTTIPPHYSLSSSLTTTTSSSCIALQELDDAHSKCFFRPLIPHSKCLFRPLIPMRLPGLHKLPPHILLPLRRPPSPRLHFSSPLVSHTLLSSQQHSLPLLLILRREPLQGPQALPDHRGRHPPPRQRFARRLCQRHLLPLPLRLQRGRPQQRPRRHLLRLLRCRRHHQHLRLLVVRRPRPAHRPSDLRPRRAVLRCRALLPLPHPPRGPDNHMGRDLLRLALLRLRGDSLRHAPLHGEVHTPLTHETEMLMMMPTMMQETKKASSRTLLS